MASRDFHLPNLRRIHANFLRRRRSTGCGLWDRTARATKRPASRDRRITPCAAHHLARNATRASSNKAASLPKASHVRRDTTGGPRHRCGRIPAPRTPNNGLCCRDSFRCNACPRSRYRRFCRPSSFLDPGSTKRRRARAERTKGSGRRDE